MFQNRSTYLCDHFRAFLFLEFVFPLYLLTKNTMLGHFFRFYLFPHPLYIVHGMFFVCLPQTQVVLIFKEYQQYSAIVFLIMHRLHDILFIPQLHLISNQRINAPDRQATKTKMATMTPYYKIGFCYLHQIMRWNIWCY